MKKNKGFTLVELLAVIAILAILVIIALPNVMGMFNNAKKNSFTTEVKQIYKVAQQQWVNDSMFETKEQVYTRCKTCTGKSLSLSGRQELEYYIKLDKSGDVREYYATDGTYQFSYSGNGLSITDITNVTQVANLNDSEKLTISNNISTTTPVSFATDSWATISSAVRSNNISVYNIGDTKQVDLGSLGIHIVRIANKSTPSDCSTSDFSQTACGFVVEFVDIISNYQMLINPVNFNVGGWEASSMRSYVSSTVYNALPNDLKSNIINTYAVSGFGSSDDSNFYTTDKIYLLAAREVWGTNETDLSDTAVEDTRQLDYYKNNGVTISNYSYAKKNLNGSAAPWLLRTPCRGDNDGWYGVKANGGWEIYGGAESYGVSPAFRIG